MTRSSELLSKSFMLEGNCEAEQVVSQVRGALSVLAETFQ